MQSGNADGAHTSNAGYSNKSQASIVSCWFAFKYQKPGDGPRLHENSRRWRQVASCLTAKLHLHSLLPMRPLAQPSQLRWHVLRFSRFSDDPVSVRENNRGRYQKSIHDRTRLLRNLRAFVARALLPEVSFFPEAIVEYVASDANLFRVEQRRRAHFV